MIDEQTRPRTPWWYWGVAVFAVLYQAAGLTQLQYLAQYPDPVLTEAGYAVGQVAGALGALGLVLRRSWARYLYMISFFGFAIQRFWFVFLSGQLGEAPSYVAVTLFMVLVVPLLMIWAITTGMKRGWVE